MPVALFTGMNFAKLFFGNDAENEYKRKKSYASKTSKEKVKAKQKDKLSVFELYDAPSKEQREFLNQIGLKPFVNDVKKWHRSNVMAKSVQIHFKDDLFKWKVAIVKKTGYRFKKEQKIWALA